MFSSTSFWSRETRVVLVLALATIPIQWSCGGDSTTGPPPPPTVASVAVSPADASLQAIGQIAQLTATARDANGGAIAGKTFAWQTSDANVATVTPAGLVTAVANGAATISATTAAVSGSASVTVDAPLTGGLRFITTTVGRNLDPDGYTIVFDTEDTLAIGLADTVSVNDLEPGPHSAILLGLTSNCYRFSSAPIVETVLAGVQSDVELGVECLEFPAELQLTFVQARADIETVNIAGLLPGGAAPILLTFNPIHDRAPEWSPDGSMLAFSRSNLIKVVRSDGTGIRSIDYGTNPSWSPNGSKLVYENSGNMFVIQVVGFGSKLELGPGATPSWSPDGSRIAFEGDVLGGEADIFVVNPDGSDRVNLTNEPFLLDRAPIWSPDGTRIAFRRLNRSEDVGYDIWAMDADGSAQVRLLSLPGAQIPSAWLPDNRILFSSSTSIMALDLGDGGSADELVGPESGFIYYEATWRTIP